MPIVGYIVQYSNEDDYTIYHGFMKLYKQFSTALEHAQELMRAFMITQGDGIQIFRTAKPTKKECDEQGSVVVFESRDYIVWIDAVVSEN